MKQAEELNRIFKECGLIKEDIHKHKHYTIIKRCGIEKIQYHKNIKVNFEIIKCEREFAAVKATGSTLTDPAIIETYGSAAPETSTNKYYLEMAEKRALSRIVLKITKLSLYSAVIGEDELTDGKPTTRHHKSKIALTMHTAKDELPEGHQEVEVKNYM